MATIRALAASLVVVLLSVGCSVSPPKLTAFAESPSTQAITAGADLAISPMAPALAHLNDTAAAISVAAKEIAAQREGRGESPDSPLGVQDWITIALAGAGGLLGMNTIRDRKYVSAAKGVKS